MTKDGNILKMSITGTFLDALPCDIPSQNWGPDEWRQQFDLFQQMGMDTVVLIRVGWKNMALYSSPVMNAPICEPGDTISLFLDESQRTGLKLYMGLYDSCKYWVTGDNEAEVSINLTLIDELLERYGEHPAFYGWYLSHEPALANRPWEIWNPLIQIMRNRTPEKPILLSPRFEGRKLCGENCDSPEDYAKRFDVVLRETEHFDAAAFMDGHVGIDELSDYFHAMKPVFESQGIELWSNLETFDRDMPFRFPPIPWLKMRYKLQAAQPFVSKIITFETPHFLSPLSMWNSAHTLYERYIEFRHGKELCN